MVWVVLLPGLYLLALGVWAALSVRPAWRSRMRASGAGLALLAFIALDGGGVLTLTGVAPGYVASLLVGDSDARADRAPEG